MLCIVIAMLEGVLGSVVAFRIAVWRLDDWRRPQVSLNYSRAGISRGRMLAFGIDKL